VDGRIIKMLKEIVGEEFVSTREDVLLAYSETASMARDPVQPEVVVRPSSTEEVSRILKLCDAEKLLVRPRSGGSSLQGEAIPKKGGLVLELMRLQSITLYEELRSVTVGAGVTFGQLDKYLGQHDLWVPVAPESCSPYTSVPFHLDQGRGIVHNFLKILLDMFHLGKYQNSHFLLH